MWRPLAPSTRTSNAASKSLEEEYEMVDYFCLHRKGEIKPDRTTRIFVYQHVFVGKILDVKNKPFEDLCQDRVISKYTPPSQRPRKTWSSMKDHTFLKAQFYFKFSIC